MQCKHSDSAPKHIPQHNNSNSSSSNQALTPGDYTRRLHQCSTQCISSGLNAASSMQRLRSRGSARLAEPDQRTPDRHSAANDQGQPATDTAADTPSQHTSNTSQATALTSQPDN